MNYELAKKLKDAGFQFYLMQMSGSRHSFKDDDGTVYAMPDLTELIEACLGSKSMTINLNKNGCGVWIGNEHYRETYAEGKSPEEAVANLWLTLNL